MRHLRLLAAAIAAAYPVGCQVASVAPEPPTGPFELRQAPADDEIAQEIAALVRRSLPELEVAVGVPFLDRFRVDVCPSRADFNAAFPPEWGIGETQCWMVATGVADWMAILSPRVWGEEACEHDPSDSGHLERLIRHELVHVLHGQHIPAQAKPAIYRLFQLLRAFFWTTTVRNLESSFGTTRRICQLEMVKHQCTKGGASCAAIGGHGIQASDGSLPTT